MDMISFKEEVLRLIAFRQEGEYWDFKKEWHKNKSDLLHDIICMANNLSNHDGLIIIGVNDYYQSFMSVDLNGERRLQGKQFYIYVGGSQPDKRSFELLGKKPVEIFLERGSD